MGTARITRDFNYVSLADLPPFSPEVPTSLADLLEFTVDDQPLGKISLYDFLLQEKIRHDELTEIHTPLVREMVLDCVDIYSRMRSLLGTSRYDLLVTNNQLYSMNGAAVSAARVENVQTLNVNLGMFLSTTDRSLFLTDDPDDYFFYGVDSEAPTDPERLSSVPDGENLVEVPKNFRKQLKKEFNQRLYGRHSLTYSPRPRHFKLNRLNDAASTIYQATLFLSSPDEQSSYALVQGRVDPEVDQSTLLRDFIDLAQNDPSKSYCVRFHPRMGSNHRDFGEPSVAKELRTQLIEAPSNVTIQYPENVGPIVDLLRRSMVVVVSWSSLGLDAATLGVPVVFGLPGFPTAYPKSTGWSSDHDGLDLALLVRQALSDDSRDFQSQALLHWLRLWSAHRTARALPVKRSPALLALALESKTGARLPIFFHHALRKMEIQLSKGFAPPVELTNRLRGSVHYRQGDTFRPLSIESSDFRDFGLEMQTILRSLSSEGRIFWHLITLRS